MRTAPENYALLSRVTIGVILEHTVIFFNVVAINFINDAITNDVHANARRRALAPKGIGTYLTLES